MTVAADFLVDLEATLQLRLVVGAEHAAEAPHLARRLRLAGLILGEGETAGEPESEGGRGEDFGREAGHGRCSSGSVAVHASAEAGFLGSTASAIEAGTGFVFSVKLKTGMITRKKPK